ncbi:hypothetical protein PR048_020483 [Dryococelus australis]|uniref:Uncharacterized protein n=1 Tax=Dryococelus australis TaxID=614101 RepID=A0ABQ9H6G7_9NEOP|nr:hypothetical protein PR048_020483 [Dryococelus australis]
MNTCKLKTYIYFVNRYCKSPSPGMHDATILKSLIKESTLAQGATVAERLAHSPPTRAIRIQSPAGSLDFRKWESCRTMPLVCGFSLGSLISPAPSFRHRSILASITLICSKRPRC